MPLLKTLCIGVVRTSYNPFLLTSIRNFFVGVFALPIFDFASPFALTWRGKS